MKQIIVFLFLMLCAVVMGAKPVFVKDLWHNNLAYVYTPVDDAGTYWAKWTLCQPWGTGTGTEPMGYSIANVVVGKVYPGKWQGHAGQTSNGYGVVDVSGATWKEGWMSHHTVGEELGRIYAADTSYIEWTLPDTHNRVHLVAYTRQGTLPATVTISGATPAFTPTEIAFGVASADDSYSIVEFVLAENAGLGTGRKLRITSGTGAGYRQFVGIKSYDTTTAGDLTTATVGIIADGHDVITMLGSMNNIATDPLGETKLASDLISKPVSGFSSSVMYRNTTEFYFYWTNDGGTTSKGTAYNSHYSATDDGDTGNANYVLDAVPTLYIDGISQGTMYDPANVANGEMHEADSIVIVSDGFSDFNNDLVEDATDSLNIKCTHNFSQNGLDLYVEPSLDAADAQISVGYVPSLPIPTAQSGYAIFPTTTAKNYFDSSYSETNTNTITVIEPSDNIAIIATMFGSPEAIWERTAADNDYTSNGSHKIYMQIENDTFDAGASGATYMFGGSIHIRRYGNIAEVIGESGTPSILNGTSTSILGN